jgi:hypothetical protein
MEYTKSNSYNMIEKFDIKQGNIFFIEDSDKEKFYKDFKKNVEKTRI